MSYVSGLLRRCRAGCPERAVVAEPPWTTDQAAAWLGESSARRNDVRVLAASLRVVEDRLVCERNFTITLSRVAARQLVRIARIALGRRPIRIADLNAALASLGGHHVLVRIESDIASAVLSPRFAVFDDDEIMRRLAPAIDAMRMTDDLRVRFLATTETITIVRWTLASSRVEVRDEDSFERGIELMSSEVGAAALTLRALTWRTRCFNFSIAPRPTLRLVHAGSVQRFDRDWRTVLASTLHDARRLIEDWRTTVHYSTLNDITDGAKWKSLRGRLVDERFAQAVAGGCEAARTGVRRG